MNILPYDDSSKESIENYAKQMKNKTFKEILDNNPNITQDEKEKLYSSFNNPKSKGSLGNLIQEHYFFYKPNNSPEADFYKAGVELKVTPYICKKKDSLGAKERLVLNIINFMEDYKYDFEESHMYSKCSLMLLVYYLYEKPKLRLDYEIKYIKLFQFPEADLEIIKKDYYTIINKIKNGKAHEISESDTIYLGACPKGVNKNSVRKQPFSDIEAPQRAFCLKQSYMTYILNNYIIDNSSDYEPIIKDSSVLKNISLEDYILNNLSKYYGQEIESLKSQFNISSSSSNKASNYLLAKGMLGVLNDKIEEFEKANIKIKTIRLNKKGFPEEPMSFPTFKYTKIVNETWETSDVYQTFSTTKYLFMIYQYTDEDSLIFKKAMFWNVPATDLNSEIKRVWTKTVEKIRNNDYTNLPKSSESDIFHVRPHGRNGKDTYPTPDGKTAKKKCFWFNKSYIFNQINNEN